jgi:hypothetical protein
MMAQKTVVTLIDDIDGERADETVKFGLDGVNYEIDLGKGNADKLRTALEPFQAAARKAAGTATPRGRASRGGRTTDRERSAEIRAWAKKHGLPVSERGRIASDLAAAYEAGDPTKLAGKKVPQAAFSA